MPPIASVDFDESTYVGNSNDGVYFDVGQGTDGWYMSAVVDCNSAHFTDTLISDEGPYSRRSQALRAGVEAAGEWCMTNRVRYARRPLLRLIRKAERQEKDR